MYRYLDMLIFICLVFKYLDWVSFPGFACVCCCCWRSNPGSHTYWTYITTELCPQFWICTFSRLVPCQLTCFPCVRCNGHLCVCVYVCVCVYTCAHVAGVGRKSLIKERQCPQRASRWETESPNLPYSCKHTNLHTLPHLAYSSGQHSTRFFKTRRWALVSR
jgi:hypothetical protein